MGQRPFCSSKRGTLGGCEVVDGSCAAHHHYFPERYLLGTRDALEIRFRFAKSTSEAAPLSLESVAFSAAREVSGAESIAAIFWG